MKDKIPLGRAISRQGTAFSVEPQTVEERIAVIEQRLTSMARTFYEVCNNKPGVTEQNAYKEKEPESNTNKDGIPIGTILIGVSRSVPFILTVNANAYAVQNAEYQSLSSAAEAVSGCRRSGWTFWKIPNGLTAKEAFKGG